MLQGYACSDSMNDTLLSLSEAAERLGVHPTTLRRWADAGSIQVVLTPGGHRRFSSAEVNRRILALSEEDSKVGAGPGTAQNSAPAQLRESVIQKTRSEATHQNAPWMQLSEEDREEKRVLGRQLMGLLMQYLAAPDDDGGEFLAEARAIGRIHAKSARQSGMKLSDVVRATQFFRDNIVESAVLLPESVQAKPDARARMHRRLNGFLNEIQLAITEVYQK